MKKRNLIAAVLCSACMVAGSVSPVFADGMKVVTLGADLSDAQKQTMLNYFKVTSDEVQLMSITNQDERDHLASYVPLEQIGTRTVSCAYVKPTQSGGIKVRTANLNWVTGNMIASTLSTSGVKNCEVVAACPFEVSGTGALTGIQMAYETASGEKLDETKKDLANQEIVVTGNLGDEVGKNEATTIVNQSKMEVIQNNIQNGDDIQNVVVNVAQNNNISLSSDELKEVTSLLEEIAKQNYDYDDVKETLERVDENVTGQADENLDTDEADDTAEAEPADSIINDVDESILGNDVIQSSTEDPSLEEKTDPSINQDMAETQETEDSQSGIPEATEDGTVENTEEPEETGTETGTEENTDQSTDENTQDDVEIPEGEETVVNTDDSTESDPSGDTEITETSGEGEAENTTEDTQADGTEGSDGSDSSAETDSSTEEAGDSSAETDSTWTADTSVLGDDQKSRYDQLALFAAGEYEGDEASLAEATGDSRTSVEVTLDPATGTSLTEAVEKDYYDILVNGTDSYVADGSENYVSTELNMMDAKLKKLFKVGYETSTEDAADGEEAAQEENTADILKDLSAEDRQKLYDDTIRFFEKLYGEDSSETAEETAEQ